MRILFYFLTFSIGKHLQNTYRTLTKLCFIIIFLSVHFIICISFTEAKDSSRNKAWLTCTSEMPI